MTHAGRLVVLVGIGTGIGTGTPLVLIKAPLALIPRESLK